MNILIVAPDYPPATRRPGSPRLYNICKQLARNHKLTLCVFGPSQERRDFFVQDNNDDRVFSGTMELPTYGGRGSDPRALLRRALHRLLFLPSHSRQVVAPDYVKAVKSAVAAACDQFQADVLYLEGLAGLQYVPDGFDIPIMIDICDCISWLYSQLARREKIWGQKFPLVLEAINVRAAERRALTTCDLTFAISPVDVAALKRLKKGSNPLVIQNGVDFDYFSYEPPLARSRTLIFTGVMDYRPNADAAVYCAEEIFPKIRQRYPDARLLLVGASPSPSVRSLERYEGVLVTGAVPDVRPCMRQGAVFVSPLRMGAGVKNKLLASMAMGIPIVANTLSLSGIAANNDEHVLVASSSQEFADKICHLFEHPKAARRISENARRFVEDNYTWSSQVALLEQALAKLPIAERVQSCLLSNRRNASGSPSVNSDQAPVSGAAARVPVS